MARAVRAKTMATRVAGDKEGDSEVSKGDDNSNEVAGNEEGDCEGGKGNSDSNDDER
jgi:hypothetical protein